MTSPNISLALRNVVRHRRRSFIAVLSICIGITSLLLAGGFIEWNLRFGRESTIHSQLGHIRLFKNGYLDAGQADPSAFLFPLEDEDVSRLLAVPGVKVVAPRLSFNGLVSHGEATVSFIGEGVAPLQEKEISRSVTITDGVDMRADDAKGIVVGQGLAANLGVVPGDVVVLMVNTVDGRVNAAEVRVIGLFATVTKAYDDSALRVPISLAHKLLRASGAHSYAVLLEETEQTSGVVKRFEEIFKGSGLMVVPWSDLADFYNKTAELFGKQVDVVRLIIALIIMLSIANSLMMSVMERTSEIGTMMALGQTRQGVLSLFLMEGAFLGVFGGMSGIFLGWLSGMGISAIGIPMPAPPGMAFGYTAEISVTWWMVVQSFVMAVLTSLVASFYPAWKASRMQIVDALRHSR
jgi:putative ABC transport system permease protein